MVYATKNQLIKNKYHKPLFSNRGFFSYKQMVNIKQISYCILLSIAICGVASFTFSCSDKKEKVVKSIYNPDSVPTIKTHNDTMYISDSGRVRFKVIAKTLMMFDKAQEPYTLFPDEAYMEEYDTLMNVITTLRADSVWNFNKKKLWKLRGRVNIVNIEGKSFDSEELFWDEQNDRMYSDLYVVINEPGKIAMRAYGFESNSSITNYTFRRATNVDIYINEDKEQQESPKTESVEK